MASLGEYPYIPRNGILLTQDPIGLAGGVNLYAYAGNNPVAFSDPWGLCPEEPCPEEPGGQGATGVLGSFAVQSWQTVQVRRKYDAATRALDPFDRASRALLKGATREMTPPLTRGLVNTLRPGTGPRAGSVGRANVPNATVSRMAEGLAVAGNVAVIGGAGLSAYRVAEADNPVRQGFIEAGAWAGGIGLGLLGGSLGGVGSLAGAYLGGELGGAAGAAIYDRAVGQ